MSNPPLKPSKTSDFPLLTYLNPREVPPLGMFSAPVPSSLFPGQFPLLTNLRLQNKNLFVRFGTEQVSESPLWTGGSFRGCYSCVLNGVPTIIAAYAISNVVRVYAGTDPTMMAEITASSGKFGNTRMTDTGETLRFSVVRNIILDVVIIQNGNDNPRVYDPRGTNDAYVSINKDFTPPPVSNLHAKALFNFHPIAGTTRPTYTNSGAHFTAADTGTTPNFSIRFTRDATAATNPTAEIKWGSQTGSQGSQYIVLVVDTFTPFVVNPVDWLSNVSIDVYAHGATVGGAYFNIYSQTFTDLLSFSLPVGASGTKTAYFFKVYPTYQLASGVGLSTDFTDGLKLTWTGVVPSAGITFDLQVFGSTPGVDSDGIPKYILGQSNYALVYAYGDSGATSVPVLLESVPPLIEDLGGPSIMAATIPFDSRVPYFYNVQYLNPTQAQIDEGMNQLIIYRQDQGADDYFALPARVGLAVYTGTSPGGAWTFAGGSASSLILKIDELSTSQRPYGDTMPTAFHKNIPIGLAMSSTNARLFVAAKSGTTYPTLWFSEYNFPFRYRQTLQFLNQQPVRASASSVELNENIQQFATVAASTLGSNSVYIFCDRTLWKVDGLDSFSLSRPQRIGPHGTLSPMSIAEDRDTLYWLDWRGQVLYMQFGMMKELSRRIVDDRTVTIPTGRRPDVWGSAFNERYYLDYTPQGQILNEKALVYEQYYSAWTEDDAPGTLTYEGRVSFFDGTAGRIRNLVFGSDSNIYENEIPSLSTDLGNLITTNITLPEWHQGMWQPVWTRRMGMLCDPFGSGSMTWNLYGTCVDADVSNPVTSIITSDPLRNRTWRWGVDGNADPPTLHAATVLPMGTGAMPGGTNIYGIVMEGKLGDGVGPDIDGDNLLSPMIWAHNIYVHVTNQSSPLVSVYGTEYTYDLGDAAGEYTRQIRSAIAAGVDGFSVDSQNYYAPVSFLTAADTVNGEDGKDFKIALCVDVNGIAGTVVDNYIAYINYYLTVAINSDSAMKVGDAFVVFTFSGDNLTQSDFDTIQAAVTEPLYFVRKLNFDYTNGSPTPEDMAAAAQAQVDAEKFQAYYGFNDIPLNLYSAIAGVFTSANKTFLGGIMLSYYRGFGVSNPFNENIDIQGTVHPRSALQNLIDNHLTWAHLSTWNDSTEHTDFQPNSTWGYTLSDLVAWYTAKFKGSALPFATPQLYVTSPQSLFLNQAAPAEVLLMNPTSAPITATITVKYSDGSTYGTASVTVPAQSLGAAQVSVTQASQPAGKYLRATVTDGTQTIIGPPILILSDSKPVDFNTTPLYYSVRADKALESNPTLAIVMGVATITQPVGVTPRFTDLVHDGGNEMHHTIYGVQGSYVVSDLTPSGSAQTNEAYYFIDNALDYGLYVARTIDVNNKVGYSNPTYVP